MDVRKIMAMPARCAERFDAAVGGNDATMAANIEKVTTKDAAP